MIRDICRDESFLAQKAEPAAADDLGTAQDLLDTLSAHRDGCVGMAANMIGVNKRIIVFDNEGEYMVMLNPVIVKKSGAYETAEGCLSLAGTRKTMRFQTIKVQWQNERFQTRLKTFTGWTAEIIQHEIDHCDLSDEEGRILFHGIRPSFSIVIVTEIIPTKEVHFHAAPFRS